MSRFVYYCAATLDGFIADPDDGLDWLLNFEGTGYEGPDAEPSPMSPDGAYERFYAGIGALVSGSTTYEFVLEHGAWPYGGKPFWVLSSRDLPAPEEDADVRVVSARAADLRDELVAAAGERDVWIVGGGNVASQFADAGMLDELIVTVVPVVLGDGKPLFDRGLGAGPLRLRGTRAFTSGMVELHYDVG